MGLKDLSQEQLLELKQAYLCAHQDERVSYNELAHANSLVTMEQLEEEYGSVEFVEEDFSC